MITALPSEQNTSRGGKTIVTVAVVYPPDTSEANLKKLVLRNRAVIAVVYLLLVLGGALED